MPFVDSQQRREELAQRLTELRRRGQIKASELARQVHMSESKISRFETARQIPTVPEVESIVYALDAKPNERRDLVTLARSLQIANGDFTILPVTRPKYNTQQDVQKLEMGSTLIRNFQAVVIPGLLQTAEYARMIMTDIPGVAGQTIPQLIATRLERQKVLFSSTQFAFIITEGALRGHCLDDDDMRAQHNHIATISTLSNVSISMLPSNEVHNGWSSYVIYDSTSVIVDTLLGVVSSSSAHDIGICLEHFDRLSERCLSGEDLRKFLATGFV